MLVIGLIIVVSGFYSEALEIHPVPPDQPTQEVLGENVSTDLVFPSGTESDYRELKELFSKYYNNHDIYISQPTPDGDLVFFKLERWEGEPIFKPLSSTSDTQEITLREFLETRWPTAFAIHIVPTNSIMVPTVTPEDVHYKFPVTGPVPEDSPPWLKNVPWHLIQHGLNYVRYAYGANLGPWEAYLMAAIWQAEGAKLSTAFGIRHYDNPYEKAEECAATIYKNINRFWEYLPTIESNFSEAVKLGKALVATAALQLYRAGEVVAGYLGTNVLDSLVPNYLKLLNAGKEENILGGVKRLEYARFLLQFIPDHFSYDDSGYQQVAKYFLDNFSQASKRDQFLIFASFFLPYVGMNYSSGYCPIWDMRSPYWIGAYEEKPGHFELNSNWGMNVYSYLSYLIDRTPSIPVTFFTSEVSYF